MMIRIVLSFCYLLSFVSLAQKKFTSLSVNDGLSHNSVLSIAQDAQGSIWFGTQDGLNKYDGTGFEVYRTDEITGLTNNVINCITQEGKGLWIGTERGLNFLDTTKKTIKKYPISSYVNNVSNHIRCITVLNKEQLYVGTRNGLVVLTHTQDTTLLKRIDLNKNYLEVNAIVKDNQDVFWIGTSKGLYYIKNKKVTYVNKLGDININTNALKKDAQENLWIGTLNSGLLVYNSKTQQITSINKQKSYLQSNDIRSILINNHQEVWVGTNNSDLLIFNSPTSHPIKIDYSLKSRMSINSTTIMDIFKDTYGNVWLGTYEGGVNLYHPYQKDFGWKTPHNLEDYNTTSLSTGRNATLWIGTRARGISKYNTVTETVEVLPFKNATLIHNTPILSLQEDKDHNLWIGTHKKGLYRANSRTKEIEKFPLQSHQTYAYEHIRSIKENLQQQLWVASSQGLYVYQPQQQNFKGYLKDIFFNDVTFAKDTVYGLSNYSLIKIDTNAKKHQTYHFPKVVLNNPSYRALCMVHTSDEYIWVGTSGAGVLQFNTKTKEFKQYTTEQGLPNNIVKSMLYDEIGNLWLTTNKGLSKFEIEKGLFKNYQKTDGLQGNDFRNRSCTVLKNGKLVFGGVNGFNVFDPKEIKTNIQQPEVLLTDVKVATISTTQPTSKFVLDKHINNTTKINLKYHQNTIQFSLASTNFLNPKKNKFSYYLEGYQKEWSVPTFQNQISFVNLPTGNYTLHIKTKNNDGVWSRKNKKIAITILPPFWKTWWAYLIYGIVFFGSLYVLVFLYVRQQKLKTTLKVNQSISSLKLELFTNISHEFRTPLTLILAPLQTIVNQYKENPTLVKKITGIHQNALRLQQMIDQLLDFRRLENHQEKIIHTTEDLVLFLNKIVNNFQVLATEKNIELKVKTSVKSYTTLFDADKLEKIVYNLLSNAFKFTEMGSINVNISITEKNYSIAITDTGRGIEKERIPFIFNRFYSNPSEQSLQKSSGIGLSYVQELVKLLQGTIMVDSVKDTGTTFTVTLPVTSVDKVMVETTVHPKELPILLVVEDEVEIRQLLIELFKESYEILEAKNGEEGFVLAEKHVPDVIISDVSMPVLNGIEFCKRLTASEKTNHIPVILLTAKTNEFDKIEGLQSGASDYINKPFNIYELKTKVENTVLSKKIIQEKLQTQLLSHTTVNVLENEHSEFLNKLQNLVEKNIADSDFDVQQITQEMNMSRAQLYRKVKAVTGLAVKDFVRSVRLKEAGEKLTTTSLQVNEIAYAVGFNNVPYFRKCFKEQYGKTPRVYRSNNS